MSVFQTHVKSNAGIYTQERSETQLHTVRVAALQNKSVGFHSVSAESPAYGQKVNPLGLLAFRDYPFNPYVSI